MSYYITQHFITLHRGTQIMQYRLLEAGLHGTVECPNVLMPHKEAKAFVWKF